jgi:ppGpp synthetase/RelA/SpoT-type nucleotidyltranferase
MSQKDLKSTYETRYKDYLLPLSQDLERLLRDLLKEHHRIDRIVARPKSAQRFLAKAAKKSKGKPRYSEPLAQIQDQVGARIVTFYLDDVKGVENIIDDYFSHIEKRDVYPDEPSEFGYEGKHYILFVPPDLLVRYPDEIIQPRVFELQIKTLFQHAWGEADHDLGYKSARPLSHEQKKLVAYAASQAWGADRVFNELAQQLLGTN